LLPFGEIAFGAGFASIRQFNETVQEVFANSPTELRTARHKQTKQRDVVKRESGDQHVSGTPPITVRLPVRTPFDHRALMNFLRARCLPGIDEVITFYGVGSQQPMANLETYRRSTLLSHGAAIMELTPHDDHVQATFHLANIVDLAGAISRARRLMDLDADPVAIEDSLQREPLLRVHIKAHPGRRSPGAVDAHELCVRAVLGQQVSVAAARTLASRLVERLGEELVNPIGTVTRLFPSAQVMAGQTPESIGIPLARARALIGLSHAIAAHDVRLGPGVDRNEARASMLNLAGIGPWTADYIAMRALSDPDVLLATDLIVRQGAEAVGLPSDVKALAQKANDWRPWGSYVTHHLWSVATAATETRNEEKRVHEKRNKQASTSRETVERGK
jgi:AraC family transcriptional regulator, regulatory protein of adaptative response / DNA-3-methyladenine glycosylase II